MKAADRQTRSHLMELFSEEGISPRNYLGQNFLIDLNLIDYIADQAELGRNDVVLEVGSGTGGLTSHLAQQAGAVISVEVDRAVYDLASRVVEPFDNVTLLNCDVLRNKNNFSPEVLAVIDEKLAESPARRLKLIANLPYNVATPVISNLVATELPWSRMVVTIQWELAQRMAARPGGGGNYGALSVWLQSQCRVKILKKLPPSVFWPRPKVHSAIVRLYPDERTKQTIADRPFFQDFVRRLFHQRRKFLRGVLVGMYRKQLDKSEIDALLAVQELKADTRAEQLEIPALVELSNRLTQAVQAKTAET